MTPTQRSDDNKRGGYSGSTDAAQVPPPAPLPSGSFPGSSARQSK